MHPDDAAAVPPVTASADWDGAAPYEEFDSASTFDYYERITTAPTLTISSADTAPRFTDACTLSDSGANRTPLPSCVSCVGVPPSAASGVYRLGKWPIKSHLRTIRPQSRGVKMLY
jgi:hypothetical protein